MGLGVFWVHDWVLPSANLAVKRFDPSTALIRTKRTSDVLLLWMTAALVEHGLLLQVMATSTSDSGKDVKRLLDVLVLRSDWSWCVPHMANRAPTEAMGSRLDPSKSKNKPARQELEKVKGVIEHLKKSSTMKAHSQEVQMDMVGSCIKLINDAPHRWLSMTNVLVKIIRL
ncbi:unnamed protein product, partial [Discosporangium mesarthrocarpum]